MHPEAVESITEEKMQIPEGLAANNENQGDANNSELVLFDGRRGDRNKEDLEIQFEISINLNFELPDDISHA